MKPTSRDKRKAKPPRKALVVAALALLLACFSGVAWAASWKSGNWKGRGKADNVCIEFKVKGSKVKSLFVHGKVDAPKGCAYDYKCFGGSDIDAPPVVAKSIRIRKNGRFASKGESGGRRGAVERRRGAQVKGKLKGSKATGTVRAYIITTGVDPRTGAKVRSGCDSGMLKWKATFRGRR